MESYTACGSLRRNVRLWHKADIDFEPNMSDFGSKADITEIPLGGVHHDCFQQ